MKYNKIILFKKNELKPTKIIKILSHENGNLDTEFIICGGNFSRNWIQCHTCKYWAHDACTNIDTANANNCCDISKVNKRLGYH